MIIAYLIITILIYPADRERKETMTITTSIGKITASKETLNDICGAFFGNWHYHADNDRDYLAKESVTIASQIFDSLKAAGYFKHN